MRSSRPSPAREWFLVRFDEAKLLAQSLHVTLVQP